MYRITGAEDLASQRTLVVLFKLKLKQEYSEMCGFVQAMISLSIMRSKCLLLHSPQDKET